MKSNINIAKFWTRIWALCIDTIILGLFGFILGLTFQDFFVSIGKYGLLFGLAITLIYQAVCNSKLMNGQTPGKRAMNIQVVDINGELLGIDKSFFRSFILSFPYFSVNLPIPGLSNSSVVNIIKGMVLSIIVIGVVVIYLFNKQTRQSLHDLAVGSFVVTTYRNEETATVPALTKTPFYVFGGLTIVIIAGTIYMTNWKNPASEHILKVYDKVSKIDGIIDASVKENTNYLIGTKALTYEVDLWVINLPKDNLENDKIVKQVVLTILNNVPAINKFNNIEIVMTREFNIGIASARSTVFIIKSPGEWKEALK